MPEPVILLDADADVEAWLAERQKGIGASEAAAVLGVDPWGNGPADIYLRKISGDIEPLTGLHLEVGHFMEPFVATKLVEAVPGLVAVRAQQLLAHHELQFIRATPDYYLVKDGDADNPGLFEVKTTWARNAEDTWACENATEVLPGVFVADPGQPAPDAVTIQWNQQAFVADITWGYVGVCIGNSKMLFFPMTRDDELLNGYMVPALTRFWHDHVLPGIPPALDGGQASARLVDILHPADKAAKPEEVPDLSDEIVAIEHIPPLVVLPEVLSPGEWPACDVLRTRDCVVQAMEDLDHHKVLLDNHLKDLVGDRTCAKIGGRKVNWSVTTKLVIDEDRARKEDAALVTRIDKLKTRLAADEATLAADYGARKPAGRSWKPGRPKGD